MNTRLLLLFLLCGFGASNVFAQQQPETAPVSDAQKTRYYNTVEYVNCKIAQYSVQNTKDAVLQADFMKSCNCNADGGTDANLQRFFAGHHLGKNAKIFKMTDSMKLSYRAGMNGTQLAGLITGYLASSKLADFASNKPTFPDFTKQLAVEVDARFVGANNPTPPPTSGQTSTAPDPIQNATETSDTAIAKFFNYFIVFLLGVLAGAVALRFWQQNKAKVRKNQRVDGENDAPNSPNSQVLEQQITALQRELENQKKLNTQLKMRFDDAFVAVNRPERAESPRTAASFVTPPIEDEESVEKNAENIVDFDDIQVLNDDILPTTKKDTSIDFEIENTISASLVVIAP
ncbi:MAG: hypothetical protein RI894_531, partial [Bacteroidota bacterium]